MNHLAQHIDAFLEYVALLNHPRGTIRNYRSHLYTLLDFLKSCHIHDIQDITQEHLYEYQRYRHSCQNRYKRVDSIAVQNHHLASLKKFFAWLHDQGFLVHDPSRDLAYAKEPQKLPKPVLTNTEVKAFLQKPDTKTLLGYRDRTILEMLYSTGIRKAELLALNCEDADYQEGFLRINLGKGAKDRVAPIGRIACRFLETYCKGIRPFFLRTREDREQPALFLNHRGSRLGETGLVRMIGRYAERSAIPKHITSHTFRRSCATEMIKHKANIMHVKELLGHSSMRAIQAYCNLSIIDLKEAHRKCHPRERDSQ